jgi:hypothetical protein
VVADAHGIGARGVRQIVALDRGVGLVGGSQRVRLPFDVGVVRRRAPDRIDERGIVGEQFRDLVGKVFANADAADVLNGIRRTVIDYGSFR